MVKTTAVSAPEADVPRETLPSEALESDVPRGTSGQFQPGHRKQGGRTRQDRSPDVGEDGGESFWNDLPLIDREAWRQTHALYLYRCEPITDKRITGKEIFVKKIFEATDPQKIMEEEGSGKYLIILNVMDPATRKGKAVYSYYFEIMNLKYPPQVPLGEWVDDPRNKKWAWAKPLLEAEQKRRVMEAHGQPGMQGMDQATQMFNAAVAAVKQLRPDKSPEEQTSLAHMIIETLQKTLDKNSDSQGGMLQVVEKVIAAVKPTSDSSAGIVSLVTQQLGAIQAELAAERAFNRDLLTKLTEKPAQPSLREVIGDMVGLKEDLKSFVGRGGGEGTRATDWLDVVREVAPEIIKTVDHGFQAYAIKKGAALERRPAIIKQNPQLPPANTAQTAGMQTETKREPTREEIVDTLERMNNAYGFMFDKLAPELVQVFLDGEPGMLFREQFIDMFGTFIYNQVKRISVETIMALIEIRKQQADPSVQERLRELQPPEKVAQFIAEFLSDAPLEEDTDGPESPDEKSTGKVRSEF